MRDVLIALAIWHLGIMALTWWAAERTTVNRIRAEAECPGPEPVARRVLDMKTMKLSCVYYWTKK